MTLKELFKKASFEGVFKCLNNCYDDVYEEKKEKIKKGFIEIVDLKGKEQDDELIIDIRICQEDGDNCYYVCGYNEMEEELYSLVFMDCEEWLELPIKDKLLSELTIDEVVAHCFWEMTYYGGWTKQEREENEKLHQWVNEQENKCEILLSKGEKCNEKMLDELCSYYLRAMNNMDIMSDIEVIVEDLITNELITNQYYEKIRAVFGEDEDILAAIELRRDVKDMK